MCKYTHSRWLQCLLDRMHNANRARAINRDVVASPHLRRRLLLREVAAADGARIRADTALPQMGRLLRQKRGKGALQRAAQRLTHSSPPPHHAHWREQSAGPWPMGVTQWEASAPPMRLGAVAGPHWTPQFAISDEEPAAQNISYAVSYTHLTLPTTPYV